MAFWELSESRFMAFSVRECVCVLLGVEPWFLWLLGKGPASEVHSLATNI